MKTTFFSPTLFISCLLILFTSMLSGCSTPEKNEQIIRVQKSRIHKLQQHVSRQKKEIEKLKEKKWLGRQTTKGSVNGLAMDLRALDQMIEKKLWVRALRFSGPLKKQYPRSKSVARRRAQIFSAMGLKKQARTESSLCAGEL